MEEARETNKTMEPEVEEIEEEAVSHEVEEDSPEEKIKGSVHISEEVVTELAKRALAKVEGIHAASPGLASKLGLGRKAAEGVRISLNESSDTPSITVDVYVMARYGLRIPDLAWDVQECVRQQLEEFTGYIVKAVNVNIQGIYFSEENVSDHEPKSPEAEDIEETAVDDDTEKPDSEE